MSFIKIFLKDKDRIARIKDKKEMRRESELTTEEPDLNLLLVALKAARKDKSGKNLLIDNLMQLAAYHNKRFDYDKALDNYIEALEHAEKNGNSTVACEIKNLIGEIYLNLSEFDKALQCYIEVLQLEEAMKNQAGVAKVLSNIGSVYTYRGDYKKALKNFKKAYSISCDINNELGMAKLLNNCAVIYIEQEKYLRAKGYLKKSYEISKRIKNNNERSFSLSNMALIFLEQEKYEKALEYLKLSLKLQDKGKSPRMTAYVKFRIAEVHSHLEDYEEALTYLHEALSIFESLNNYMYISYCYSLCADIYEKNMNYKETIRYLRLNLEMKDKISQKQNDKLMAELEVKHGLYHKEKETQLYRTKNAELNELNNQLKYACNELENLSRKDYLTNVSNRRDIINYLEQIIAREKKSCSIILGDIDNFKSINDRLGHDMGDHILIETASIIKAKLTELGKVALWGGEEFLIVLPEINVFRAKEIAEDIRKVIAGTKYDYRENSIAVTMTFGISECSIKEDVDRVIKKADEALYIGKNKGKNCVILNENC